MVTTRKPPKQTGKPDHRQLPRFRIAKNKEQIEKIREDFNSATNFQEEFLSAKLAKEKGQADQAQSDAAMKRIELDELTGKLVTMDKAQNMLEEEHAAWIAYTETLPQEIMSLLSKRGFTIEQKENIKDACEAAVSAMRTRMSRE